MHGIIQERERGGGKSAYLTSRSKPGGLRTNSQREGESAIMHTSISRYREREGWGLIFNEAESLEASTRSILFWLKRHLESVSMSGYGIGTAAAQVEIYTQHSPPQKQPNFCGLPLWFDSDVYILVAHNETQQRLLTKIYREVYSCSRLS